MLKFELSGAEFIPLCDLLKTVGFCENGGHAKTVIAEGLVFVNGEVETRKRCKIRSGSKVQFEDNQVEVC